MLEYILIIVLLVNIVLDIYIVKKVDAVKKNIRSNKDNSKSRLEKRVDGIERVLDNKAHVNVTHDIWEELADLRTEIKSLKTKDVNTSLESNINTTNDAINTHESVMTIDTEKNLYEAQLYKLIDKVHKSKINNRYKIKDLDTEIKLFKDNSLAVVITSDIEESKVLGVSVYDIDDLDDIDLLYTT